MKFPLIILSIVALALFSCAGGEENVKIPPDIIPPDSMVYIFVDFQLAESATQEMQQQRKDPKIYSGYYYSMITKKHHLSLLRYDKSLQFYSHHSRLLIYIYDKVLSELSTKQGKSMLKTEHGEKE